MLVGNKIKQEENMLELKQIWQKNHINLDKVFSKNSIGRKNIMEANYLIANQYNYLFYLRIALLREPINKSQAEPVIL